MAKSSNKTISSPPTRFRTGWIIRGRPKPKRLPALESLVGDRVFLGTANQDERRPRVVLTLLSRTQDHDMDGPAGPVSGEVQIACLATDDPTAKSAAAAARSRINGYTGTGFNVSVDVDFIHVTDEQDIQQAAPQGQGSATFGVAMTAQFQMTQD